MLASRSAFAFSLIGDFCGWGMQVLKALIDLGRCMLNGFKPKLELNLAAIGDCLMGDDFKGE